MSATLKLRREGAFLELRRGTFEILVDDQSVGSIEPHDTIERSVDGGHHTLRIRKGRYSSPVHSFDVVDGGVTNFRCHGANIWPTYVASFVVPTIGISLRRE